LVGRTLDFWVICVQIREIKMMKNNSAISVNKISVSMLRAFYRHLLGSKYGAMM